MLKLCPIKLNHMKAAIVFLDILLRIAIIISIISLMFACEPTFAEPYETFLLPEGKHSKNFPLQTLQSDVLEFTAIFDESAIYASEVAVNQFDVNKLMGFSDCNSHHHKNSARFGWAWQDEQLQISAYAYADSERIIIPMGNVELNEPVHYQLSMTSSQYVFRIGSDREVRIDRKNECTVGLYYMLFPYFGGNEVAPHDISIKVKLHY